LRTAVIRPKKSRTVDFEKVPGRVRVLLLIEHTRKMFNSSQQSSCAEDPIAAFELFQVAQFL
jgi:hypothetical protein